MRTAERTRTETTPLAAPEPRRVSAAGPLALWAGLVVVAHLWGRHLLDSGLRLKLGPEEGAPPIVGDIDLRLGLRVLPVAAMAVLGTVYGPRLAARLTWRRLLLASAAAWAVWAVALAFTEPGEWKAPLLNTGEYMHDVGRVGNPFTFLSHFADRIADYDIHTEGHPPGFLLLLSALEWLGFSGPAWAASLVIAVGALAAPAVLVTVQAVSDEARARHVAPFLVLAPVAVWAVTSADGLYMGVMAVGVACLARAGVTDRRADLLALASGLLFGAALFFTYGAVLFAPVPAAVAWAQRRVRPLAIAAAGCGAVVVAFWLSGFWWVEGLLATRVRYWDGVASIRPYEYFLLANLAAFALVVGPATAVAVSRLRRAGPWLLPAAGLAGIVLADLSAMSKAEVERIWLPWAPWVLVATVALAASARARVPRGWLGLQAATAVAIQVGVRTPW
jgi:hypothetical protein